MSAVSGVEKNGPTWNLAPNNKPTITPKIICRFCLCGIVYGSVSMMVAKKSSGHEVSTSRKSCGYVIKPEFIKLQFVIVIETIAAITKAKNKLNLRIFRTTSKPSTKMNGVKSGVATHQLAPSKPIKGTVNAAIAAGLNKCFFLIAKTYLERVAIAAAEISMYTSRALLGGEKIRNRIRPVITEDSIFIGADSNFPTAILSRKLPTTSINKERTAAEMEYEIWPVPIKTTAQTVIAMSELSTTRYMV